MGDDDPYEQLTMASMSTGVASVAPLHAQELTGKGDGSTGPSSRTERSDERGEHSENCSGQDRVYTLRGLVFLTLVAATASKCPRLLECLSCTLL